MCLVFLGGGVPLGALKVWIKAQVSGQYLIYSHIFRPEFVKYNHIFKGK